MQLLCAMRGHPACTQHRMRTSAVAGQVTHRRTQLSRAGKHGAIPTAEQAPRVTLLSRYWRWLCITLTQCVLCVMFGRFPCTPFILQTLTKE